MPLTYKIFKDKRAIDVTEEEAREFLALGGYVQVFCDEDNITSEVLKIFPGEEYNITHTKRFLNGNMTVFLSKRSLNNSPIEFPSKAKSNFTIGR